MKTFGEEVNKFNVDMTGGKHVLEQHRGQEERSYSLTELCKI